MFGEHLPKEMAELLKKLKENLAKWLWYHFSKTLLNFKILNI